MRVDAHVELREVREVPHDLRLAQLGQSRRRSGEGARGQQLLDRLLGHIALGQPVRAAAGFGEFEQEFCIAGVTHDY